MDKLQHKKAVLIIGRYGIVGKQMATILREKYPQIPLINTGRDIKKAKYFADSLGYAQGIAMDVTKINQISSLHIKLAAIVTATNDPNNYILLDTIRNHPPYIDVTRWTARLKESIFRISGKKWLNQLYFFCMDRRYGRSSG